MNLKLIFLILCNFVSLTASMSSEWLYGESLDEQTQERNYFTNQMINSLSRSEKKLLKAAQTGNIELAKQAWQEQNNLDNQIRQNFSDENWLTPLMLAIKNKHHQLSMYLIEIGFNLNLNILTNIEFIEYDDLAYLIKHPTFDINYQDDKNRTILMHAGIARRKDLLKLLLDQIGINLELKDRDDQTAISNTAKSSDKFDKYGIAQNAIIRALATAGADISKIQNEYKPSQAQNEIIILLARTGTDISKLESDNKLSHALKGRLIYNKIIKSVKEGNIKEIAKSQKKNCTLNIKDTDGNNPLHLAIINAKAIKDINGNFLKHDLKIIVTILSYKPDLVCVKNKNGLTPIELTIAVSKFDILEYLIFLGKAQYTKKEDHNCIII